MGKGKKKLLLFLAGASICLLAAVFCYKGARLLADEITVEAEKNAEKAGLFKPKGIEEEVSARLVSGEKTINKIRPLTLIYIMDYETGKVEQLSVMVFDTVDMTASFIYFDPEISYTMTGTLYRSLANGNVLVPQTVRMSGLYGYYGNLAAFEAGRKIMSELMGMEVDYYISLSKEDAHYSIMEGKADIKDLEALFDTDETETDIGQGEEEAFKSFIPYIEEVKAYEAPVIKRNESSFADVVGLWGILGEIIPEE